MGFIKLEPNTVWSDSFLLGKSFVINTNRVGSVIADTTLGALSVRYILPEDRKLEINIYLSDNIFAPSTNPLPSAELSIERQRLDDTIRNLQAPGGSYRPTVDLSIPQIIFIWNVEAIVS